jgi:hypothetical protein
MKTLIAKLAEDYRKGSVEIFHAAVKFRAEVTAEEHNLQLIAAKTADGWLTAVVYPDTSEAITLADYRSIADAKAGVQGWVHLVHNVNDVPEWIVGPPPSVAPQLGAKS